MVNVTHNPELSDYRVYLTKRSGLRYILLDRNSSVVEKIIIDQDIENPTIELALQLVRTEDTDLIANGDIVDIYGPVISSLGVRVNQHLWQFLMMEEMHDFSGTYGLVGRNIGHWSTTSSFYIKIENNETASELITRTAQTRGIPIDFIEPTTYRLSAGFFENITLYSLWLHAVSKTMIEEDKNYHISFSPRGLRLDRIEALDSAQVFWYEVDGAFSNMIEPSRKNSILDKDFVNVARGIVVPTASSFPFLDSLVEKTEERELRNEGSIASYGEFPRDVNISQFRTNAEVTDHLERILERGQPVDKISFRSFATNALKPINRIFVSCSQIGATGQYFIQHITTIIEDGFFREDISASKLRDIPQELLSLARREGFLFGGVDLSTLNNEGG